MKFQKHNYGIDIMRFIAAMMVVFFHLNQAVEPVNNWYRNLVEYGWLGVPIFFVISGFCIMTSLEQSPTLYQFFLKRIYRIYPAYYVSLITILLAAAFQKILTGTNSVKNIPNDLVSILGNLTLMTAPLTKIPTMNWVYWSLTCEVMFYIILGLTKMTSAKLTPIFLVIISFIAILLPTQGGFLFFIDHWPAFGCGVGLFYYFSEIKMSNKLYGGSLIILNLANLFFTNSHGIRMEYFIATICILFSLIAVHFFRINSNLFAKMGQHSYSVYLIHVPVGVFVLGMFKNSTISANPWWNLSYDLLVFLIVSILAWIIYILVEHPFIKWAKAIVVK